MLVLDGVTDPHNLGACLRVADGAGAHAVIAPKDHAVGINATVAKVASGAAETVPYFMVTNLARTLGELKERDIRDRRHRRGRAALDLRRSTSPARSRSSSAPRASGLRQLTARTCDELVHLPMKGAVESLNVSVASGVCLYEAARQRLAARSVVGRVEPAPEAAMPVIEVTHPLVRHKVGLLRDASLSTKSFREITAELGRLLTYEATADFPLESVPVRVLERPGRGRAHQRQEGDRRADPARRPRHARRRARHDPEREGQRRRHRPQPRDAACPSRTSIASPASLHARTAIVLDPMLATGGSMNSAVALLKSRGATDIRALVLVAAPEGIAALTAAHPDVRCWTAAIDSHLDAQRLHHPRPRRRRRPHLRHALMPRAVAQTQPSAPTTAPSADQPHRAERACAACTAMRRAISAIAPSACAPTST